jgi:hypothetical protein
MNGASSDRMGMISRIAIEYAREMMEDDRHGPRLSGAIEQIDVPPVRLSLDVMSDHAAARELAAAICRALARGVES